MGWAFTWASSPRTIGVRPKRFLSWRYVCRKMCTYLAPTLTLSPNRKKWDSTWPISPRSSIWCVQMISEHMARLTQTVQLSCVNISTISKWSEIAHDQHHLGVPSGASKLIFEPMIRSTQTVHLSCDNISTISERTETSFHLSLIT